jgi:hypothetical protein
VPFVNPFSPKALRVACREVYRCYRCFLASLATIYTRHNDNSIVRAGVKGVDFAVGAITGRPRRNDNKPDAQCHNQHKATEHFTSNQQMDAFPLARRIVV